jgi:hypothetical protein
VEEPAVTRSFARTQTERLLADVTGVDRFDAAQVARARHLFSRMASCLGVGDPAGTEAFGGRWYAYQAVVIRAALDGYARALLGAPAPSAWAPLLDAPSPGGSLTPARLVRVLDVNHSTADELAAVPGIGPARARHIVAARAAAPFATLDAVRRASRLTAAQWEPVAPLLAIVPETAARIVPGTRSFRTLLAEAGRGAIVHAALPPGASPSARALAGLSWCADRIATRRVAPPFWAPSPRTLLAASLAIDRRARAAAAQPAQAALLRNAAYIQLLRESIAGARASIHVTMFFFSVNDTGPGAEILDLLRQAMRRGVDVRVLLGHDLPDDPHGAAGVNARARVALRRARIPFRLHWPEVALHEKSVVIDGRRVLAGSHNWTAHGFYLNDETSLYVDSPAVGARLDRRFLDRWGLLAGRGRRRVPLAALAIVGERAAAALEAAGVSTADQLPGSQRALAQLAETATITTARLTLARQVGALMSALRIAEITAVALATAGLDTPASVKRASSETVRAALTNSSALPPPFTGCAMNADIAATLTGGSRV